jgi:hypothetical protein
MVINSYRNKPLGPGGSTRRLHHSRLRKQSASSATAVFLKTAKAPFSRQAAVRGAKQDRLRCKGSSFARDCTDVIGLLYSCK